MSTRNSQAAYWGGGGVLRAVIGTNPVAGAEVVEAVPSDVRWRLLSVEVRLDTDATVANRLISFEILDDAGNLLYAITSGVVQTASQVRRHILSGSTFRGDDGFSHQLYPMPPDNYLLNAGFVIRTVTSALQAGDNFRSPTLLVEQWQDPL